MTHSSSSSFVARRSLRAGLALTGATLAVIALAGCAPESGAEPSASSSPSASAGATAEPSAGATDGATAGADATTEPSESATPKPEQKPAGTEVDMSCDQVLTAEDLYALNPNFSEDPGYSASSDAAETATSYDGIACGWLNQSSGEIIEVALALPNGALADSLKDSALSSGEIVPTYGSAPSVEGYFSAASGTAQVFTDGYWVAVTSPTMAEPGDAERIMITVLGNL